MSSYIDTKFINLLSNRLPKFKQKSDYLWNFRCPHCGDSQKSSTKARGFVYQKKNDLFYLAKDTQTFLAIETPKLLINQFLVTNETVYIYDSKFLYTYRLKIN